MASHPRHRLPKTLSRTAYKLHLLHRLNEQQPHKAKHATAPKHKVHTLKRFSKRSVLTGATIVLILAVTGFVSFDTWQTNNLAKQAFVKDTTATDSTSSSSTDRQSNEGKDESPLPANVLANYRVASNLPRALYINKLDVAARVLPMGVNNDGSMQAPLGIYDAGWYSGSVQPGETGAMVLNGHSSGPTRQALLGNLDTLKLGDEIFIEKGDKSRLKYVVKHTETLPLEAVDMNKVMLPYGTAKSGLNIYTCTGKWLPAEQTFDHRVIVYAVEA
jgi:sortase (surface protein transpeptidase)